MDKIINLIDMYVDRLLLQFTKRKTNKKAYKDFSLLAKYAYNNRTAESSSTWVLRELLRCHLTPSAHQGFWQTFDALVGDAFNTLLSTSIKQVLYAPGKYDFNVSEVLEHFIEQQLKDTHPRTLPEEIRWFLAGAVQEHICSIATDDEHKLLIEICSGDFGQPYIEHLLLNNDDVHEFINKVAQDLLK